MKKEQISEALSFLDDDLIEQTNKLRMAPRSRKVSYIRWVKYASCVAAAALVLVVGVNVLKNVRGVSMKSADYAAPSFSTMQSNTESDEYDYEIMTTAAPGTYRKSAEAWNTAEDGECLADEASSGDDFYTSNVNAEVNEPNGIENSEMQNFALGFEDKSAGAQNESDGLFSNGGLEITGAASELCNGSGGGERPEKPAVKETSDVLYEFAGVDENGISFIVTNNGSETIIAGPEWFIDVLVDGDWCDYAYSGIGPGSTGEIFEVKPGEIRCLTYPEFVIGKLDPGAYRIIQEFIKRKKGPDDETSLVLGMSFVVE